MDKPHKEIEGPRTQRIGSLITLYIGTKSKAGEVTCSGDDIATVLGKVFKNFSMFKGHGYWPAGSEDLYRCKILTEMPVEELLTEISLMCQKLDQPSIGFEVDGSYHIVE
jgi:hypothetical protein